MPPYRVPAPALALPRIDWLAEEISYGRFVQRAWRVFDGDGSVMLHLRPPPLDLKVSQWVIVKGAVDKAGRIALTVRCESGGSCGKQFELAGEAGSVRWQVAGTSLEGPGLTLALTRLAKHFTATSSLDIDAVLDAIGPRDDDRGSG